MHIHSDVCIDKRIQIFSQFKSRKLTPFSLYSTTRKLPVIMIGSDPYFISFLHFHVCMRGRHDVSCATCATPSIAIIVRYRNAVKNNFCYKIFACVWKCCPVEEINSIYRRRKFSGSGIVCVAFIQRRLIEYHSLPGFQVLQFTCTWWLESNNYHLSSK